MRRIADFMNDSPFSKEHSMSLVGRKRDSRLLAYAFILLTLGFPIAFAIGYYFGDSYFLFVICLFYYGFVGLAGLTGEKQLIVPMWNWGDKPKARISTSSLLVLLISGFILAYFWNFHIRDWDEFSCFDLLILLIIPVLLCMLTTTVENSINRRKI